MLPVDQSRPSISKVVRKTQFFIYGHLKKKQSKIQMGEDIVMYIVFFPQLHIHSTQSMREVQERKGK